jgi:hypothetical protein
MDYFTMILLILIILILASIIISIGVYKIKSVRFKFQNLKETEIIAERLSINEKLKAKIKRINQKFNPTATEKTLSKLHQKLKNKSNKLNESKNLIECDKQELIRSADSSLDFKDAP